MVFLFSACGSHRRVLNPGLHEQCPIGAGSEQDQTAAETAREASARTVAVGDTERSYRLYIPSGLDEQSPVPLVSIHHGYSMSDGTMEHLTRWKQIAEREKFVVVFAKGVLGAPWYVGEHVCGAGARVAAMKTQDDFGFLRAIITATQQEQRIDAVFVAGFSMGGYFANHVGCHGRDMVRAVAAHSAGTYEGPCPGKPVPVLTIHGDDDSLIRYSCGQEAHDTWVERNGCSNDTRCEPIRNGVCEWNRGCPAGQEVGMCTLRDMSHGWAGAPYTGPWLLLQYGGGAKYEDAAELMWRFFARTLAPRP
ncbi:MAG TPA: PHB depolymerase family esterase [Polyangiales bacterium]|nr:PHB depolymerase family esterase [Polyangiales bacterium]